MTNDTSFPTPLVTAFLQAAKSKPRRLWMPIPKFMIPVLRQNEVFAYLRPLSDAEIQAFLQEVTPEDDDRVSEVWDRHSGLAGLLDADIIQETVVKFHGLSVKQNQAKYIYDLVAGRYRSLATGRYVAEASIRNGVLRVSNAMRLELRELTGRLVAGQINPDQWYRTMLRNLKDEYRSQWIASIGGKKMYTRSQAALFGRAAAPQFRWLNNFLAELQSGKQALNGRAIQRAGMYARAGNVIYYAGRLQEAMRTGNRYAKRVLGETDQHCHDNGDRPGCVELSRKGWVRIELIVPIGSASCFSNCVCSLLFAKTKPKPKKKKPTVKPKRPVTRLPHGIVNVPPRLRLLSAEEKPHE